MIPRRVREEAALIASAVACTTSQRDDEWLTFTTSLGVSQDAWRLYWFAWCEAQSRNPHLAANSPLIDAEAEAMLRTGWEP